MKKTLLTVNNFFRKLCVLRDNVEKYCRSGQAIDKNMTHVHCVLDTQGYKYKLRMCKIYCFSTATKVAISRLNITLHVHCFVFASKKALK
jgi:hypothetical protein